MVAGGEGGDAVGGERQAVFRGARSRTPVLLRDRMPTGYRGAGPAIIEEQSATTVVPDGWQISVDDDSNIILTRGGTA